MMAVWQWIAGVPVKLRQGQAHATLLASKPAHERSDGWPAVRRAHILKESRCMACGGVTHLEVHHLWPFHLYPERELDPTNLITLCEQPGRFCHLVFGHYYDFKKFNPHCREDVLWWSTRLHDILGERTDGL
jgi:5-methylcytosine-specific restriction enzyme A